MLSKQISILSIIFTLISCASHNKAVSGYKAYKPAYKKVASELVAAINSGKSSKSELIRLSEQTMAKARPILTAFSKENPKCEALVSFMLENEKSMKSLTPEKIETDYHDGGALPKFADECHDIKEILIHPATVISLANHRSLKQSKEQMFDEMEEVLSHLDTL